GLGPFAIAEIAAGFLGLEAKRGEDGVGHGETPDNERQRVTRDRGDPARFERTTFFSEANVRYSGINRDGGYDICACE
ncbi:MAG: hypothetical protein ABIO75_00505, partial [Thermomonas sp.]